MFFPPRQRAFAEHYRCYPAEMLPGSRTHLSHGGKIILPPSALAKLAALHIEYPMIFELHPDHDVDSNEEHRTHAGVLEFVAEEGRVYVPPWMMRRMGVEQGEIVRVSNVTLPLGKFVKIQPQSVDFLSIHDPKAVLENALRQYTTLTQGDIISISYNNKVYDLLCMETKPGNKGISVIETDLEVDFAPPVGYVEPSAAPKKSSSANSMNVEEHKVDASPTKFMPFAGSGARLNGKALDAHSPLPQTQTQSAQEEKKVPKALRLPSNKLWFGYDVKPYQGDDVAAAPDNNQPSMPPGPGHSLRAK